VEVSITRRLLAAVAVPVLLGAAAAWGSTIPAVSGTLTDRPHRITGTAHADHLTGTARPDLINGEGGNDVIRGLGGDDDLRGGEISGLDTLYGGPGNDVLRLVNGGRAYGGPGNDTIYAVYLFTRSVIDCGPGNDLLFLTDETRQNVTIRGCEKIVTTPIN
jgi:Ca2+-binding RTX toxin-like protein